MIKHYLLTTGAMIACAAFTTQARSPYLNYDPSDKTWDMTWNGSQLVQATTAKASDWMADLPDNMLCGPRIYPRHTQHHDRRR